MNSSAMLTAIINKLSSVLPGLFLTAGLANFDEYVHGAPTEYETKSLAIYLDSESDSTDLYNVSFLIQAQLYQIENPQAHHAVIFDAIRENITPALIGMETRNRIDADLWPINENTSTSIIYYLLDFERNLDDCDD